MPLARLELWNTIAANGGSRLSTGGFLPYRTAWSTTRSLINPESMTFSIPGNSEAASLVRKGLVARRWKSDSDVDWWPIDQVVTNRASGTDVDVTCSPLSFLLGQHGIIADPLASPLNGIPSTSFGFVGLTFTEMLTTYVTTNASVTSVLPWVTLGTIEPTATFDLDVQDVNTLSLITAGLGALAALGVLAEFQLDPSGAINIFTTIGSTAPKFFVRVGKNLQSLKRTVDGSQQYSRLSPKLATLSDGTTTAIGNARWAVTNVASNVITLADPAEGAGPMGFDDQLNGLYVYVEATGSFVAITDSSAANQTVTLTSGTGISNGMLLQFRTTNGSPAGVPTFLDWPLFTSTTPPGIGIVAGQIDKSTLQAVPNLAVNGTMRSWATPTALPDGYTFRQFSSLGATGATSTPTPIAGGGYIDISQNTDPLFTNVAKQNLHFRAINGTLVSPPAKVTPWFDGMPVSVRLRLILTNGWDPTLNSGALMRMNLGIMKADGSIVQWFDDKRVAYAQPGNGRPSLGGTLGPEGQFVDIILEDQDITTPSLLAPSIFAAVQASDISDLSGSAQGLVVMLNFAWSAITGFALTPIEGYIDSIMITPGGVPPDTQSEFGEANQAWQATNAGLALVNPAQASYEVALLDLARLNLDVDPSASPTLGGSGVIFDAEVGANDNERLVEIVENQCVEGDTKLTFSNKNKRLTDLLFQPGAPKSGSPLAGTTTAVASTGGTSPPSSGGTLAAPVVTLTLDGSNVPTAVWTVPLGVNKTWYAWSTSAQPTAADALAGTEIDAPADFTATTSAITSGQTIYITVVGKDTFGQTTPAGFAHLNLAAPPGVPGRTDMAPLFVEDGGGGPRHTDTLYIYENEGMVHSMTGGRNNGPHWLTRNFTSQATYMSSGSGTKEGRVLCWIDLTGKTIVADGQLLYQAMNNGASGSCHLAFGLDSSRHVLVYRTDNGSDALLQTSTVTVPASGRYLLEFGFLIHASAGYVTCRGYDISAGSPTTKTDFFDVTGIDTLSSFASVAEDIEICSWGSDAFTTTAFQVGGIDDIPMGGFAFFDATGLGHTAFVGDVMALSAFVASAGHYADAPIPWQLLNCKEAPGYLSAGEFESSTQRNSYGIATFNAANVGSVLAVSPFGTYANSAGTGALIRPGVRSGSTDADNGTDLRVVFSDWGGSLGKPSDGLDKAVYFTVDPATSAAWAVSAAQAAEPIFQSKGSDRLVMTQAGLTIVYRPANGTDGQVNGSVGSRDQPVTPLEWMDLGATNTTGQGVHANYKNDSAGTNRIQGDPFTNATAGADGGRAMTYNHSYAGSGVWPGGNFGVILGPVGGYWLTDFPPSFANGSFSAPAFIERSQQKTAGIWVNFHSNTLSADLKLFSFYDTSGVEAVAVFLTTARKVRVDNIHGAGNPFNLVAATATALSSNGLNQVEVELGLDTVFGYVNVWRIDGSTGTRTLIGSASGIDTRHTSGKNIGGVAFGFALGTANGDGLTVSDAFVASCGTTGGGTGLGGCRAATLLANAVGAHNSSGGPYTKVTDDLGSGAIPDGDYNVLTAAAQEDTYKVQGAPGDCVTVLGAMPIVYVSRAPSGSGTNQGRMAMIIGGAELRGREFNITHDWPDGDGGKLNLSSSLGRPLVATLNPSTGSALAPADFGGGNAEVGYLLSAHNNDHWIRQVVISLLYAWTH
ncbi:MAG TPA: hypothetical protein VGQ44_17275 [Gemmatimonadaceae bacterium]|jgi:hypothetical protein|nr:hypothetical protein [Gemmatimonadaceae bacterium]